MVCIAERKLLSHQRVQQCILDWISFMGLMVCIAGRKPLPKQKPQQCILEQNTGMCHHAVKVLLLHPLRSGAAASLIPRRRHPQHHLRTKTKISSSACICWWRLQWPCNSRRRNVSWHYVYNASLLTV